MSLPPFEQIVEQYGSDVWRFAASQVGAERADDVFQETMLAALAAYPKLRKPHAVRAWLLKIAARKALDVFRRRDPEPRAALETGTAADPEPADAALWARVGRLPRKQRHAVALRFVLDLEYADIGAAMETTAEAARRNVFGGLKALRTTIDPLEIR
jgi:RNA polymerase sigma factor (sigma-70 family)